MIRADLVKKIADKRPQLFEKDIEKSVKEVINALAEALVDGDRIEIRGFGTFNLRQYARCYATNPKTREKVSLNVRSIPHFKVGKALHNRLNKND